MLYKIVNYIVSARLCFIPVVVAAFSLFTISNREHFSQFTKYYNDDTSVVSSALPDDVLEIGYAVSSAPEVNDVKSDSVILQKEESSIVRIAAASKIPQAPAPIDFASCDFIAGVNFSSKLPGFVKNNRVNALFIDKTYRFLLLFN